MHFFNYLLPVNVNLFGEKKPSLVSNFSYDFSFNLITIANLVNVKSYAINMLISNFLIEGIFLLVYSFVFL